MNWLRAYVSRWCYHRDVRRLEKAAEKAMLERASRG